MGAALLGGSAARLVSIALALTGLLGAMSLDFTAQSFPGSQVRLAFGCGLVLGLTGRPRRPPER